MTITFATYTNSPPYRTVTVVSPALDSESVRFMNCSGESFGEIVCIHEISGTLDTDKPSIWVILSMIDIAPKEVIFCVEILGSGGESLVRGEKISTLVVFKDSTVDFDGLVCK